MNRHTTSSAAAHGLQLVEERDGRYVLCQSGCQFLLGLDSNVDLSVVVVAGKYRTGKSFLLNRAVVGAAPKAGFSTGSTINACTKGIWLHPTVLCGESGHAFVVVDTEGTASMEATLEHDVKLISIALALSSIFIYNSMGSIDEASLSDLGTLTMVASSLAKEGDLWDPPELLWVLRDFSLELRDEGGLLLSPNDYLERALDNETCGKADVRASLRSYFPRRRLFTMVRPCIQEAQLQKLNSLAPSTLRQEFQQQVEGLRQCIRTMVCSPKRVGGAAINGYALFKLAEAAVEATNEGQVPSVQSAFSYLQERRCSQAIEDALLLLQERAGDLERRLPLPGSELALAAPSTPDFLCRLPDTKAIFDAAVQRASDELEGSLRVKNEAARESYLRQELDRAAACEELDFEGLLASLAAKLGVDIVLDPKLVSRLHAACISSYKAQAETAERRFAKERGERAEALQELAEQALAVHRLQGELDEAQMQLVAPSELAAQAVVSLEEALAQLRQDLQSELASMAQERDCAELRLHEVSQQLLVNKTSTVLESEHSRALCEVDGLRAELQRAVERETGLVEAKQRELEHLHQHGATELRTLQAHFETIVRDSEARAKASEERRRCAEKRTETAESQLLEFESAAQKQAQEVQDRYLRLMQKAEEDRRVASSALAERVNLMKESYDSMAQESLRLRESVSSAERRALLLEVDRDSLKRRVEALQVDTTELCKVRRCFDEAHVSNKIMESKLENASVALEAERRMVQKLEAELREAQQAALHREREFTFRVARLEVELAAKGAPVSA